jgi:Flp pilus assembly pilin Flp
VPAGRTFAGMRDEMRSERGQATVEWTGVLLLIALALVALSHLAPKADGRELGTELAHSVTATAMRADRRAPSRSPADRRIAGTATPPPVWLPKLPASLRRARRGVGALWRKAWFACLVYERTRYALRHFG